MHHNRKLTRRKLLEGCSAFLAAAPFLGRARSAHAQGAPTRFVSFMTAHDNMETSVWHPGVGSGEALPSSLPSYLGALDAFIPKTTLIGDVVSTKRVSDDHEHWGVVLTGRDADSPGDNEMGGGPSIDHVIADRHGERSLVIGYQANERPAQTRNYASWASRRTGNPAILPHQAFDQLFGGVLPMNPAGPDPEVEAARRRNLSVLDFVAGEIGSTMRTLPVADRFVLEAHLDGIRDLENQLMRDTPVLSGGAECGEPEVDEINYRIEETRGEQFPLLLELSNRVSTMAIKCDLRRSIVLQYSSCANHYIYPRWPDNPFYSVDVDTIPSGQSNNNWHSIIHGGNQPYRIECEAFMAHVFRRFLEDLDVQEDTTGTFLDHSVCLWMRAMGVSHRNDIHRFAMIVGHGAEGRRLKGGTFYDAGGDEDNDVLVTCMQAAGFDDTEFGEGRFCDGPYPVFE